MAGIINAPSPADQPLANIVAANAASIPQKTAFSTGENAITWQQYHHYATELAGILVAQGLEKNERVALLLPDAPAMHIALLALEKAGLVAVGISPRADRTEAVHLLKIAGATTLISANSHKNIDPLALFAYLQTPDFALRRHILLRPSKTGVPTWEMHNQPMALTAPETDLAALLEYRRHRSHELFMLNTTSGTTGMPKCVAQNQDRWLYFSRLVIDAGQLSQQDRFLVTISNTMGFGLWATHFTPSILGCPVVLVPDYHVEPLLQTIEQQRPSVLIATPTQLAMMVDSPSFTQRDLSSLRIVFTGGECLPYGHMVEFENATDAVILQFYGTNEAGPLSYTNLQDDRDKRLRTAGRVIEEMQVRLVNEQGEDITATGIGQPACRGPGNSLGYYKNEPANQQLLTTDGLMQTHDLATLDKQGYLSIIGRSANFSLKAGQYQGPVNMEQVIADHSAVTLAVIVSLPNRIYGEAICAYVTLRKGFTLSLETLKTYLLEQGIAENQMPHLLVVKDTLPVNAAGKIARGELARDARRQIKEWLG